MNKRKDQINWIRNLKKAEEKAHHDNYMSAYRHF